MTGMHDHADSKPVVAVSIAAGLLLLILGAGHRGLAALLKIPVQPARVARGALDGLPMQIGDWTGEEVLLDEAIEGGTDTDACISRRYVRGDGSESISLYIACGVHVSRVMAHRPEHCYDRAGFALVESSAKELPMNDGAKLPCDILRFSLDGPQTRGVTVLRYWIAGGQRHDHVSHLTSNLWHILRAVDYVAQIQISASTVVDNPEAAARCVADFAADSAEPITRLFQDLEKDRHSAMSGRDPGGE